MIALVLGILLSWPIPVPDGVRLAEVTVPDGVRLHFQDEPRPCPARGPCAWRRQAYLVPHDRVAEEKTKGGFSYVTFVRYEQQAPASYDEVSWTSGWVPSKDLCLFRPLRKRRGDPRPPLDAPGRTECAPDFTRTVEDDQSFFVGTFRSATATLTVADFRGGELDYRLAVTEPGCPLALAGTAFVHRAGVFNDPAAGCHVNLSFDDRGARVRLTACADGRCADRADDLSWVPIPSPAR